MRYDVLATGGDDGMTVRTLRRQADGQVKTDGSHTCHSGFQVQSLAFSHDTLHLAAGEVSASLWDGSAKGRTRSFTCDGATVNAVAFSHDDTLVATGDSHCKVRLWRVGDVLEQACAEHQLGAAVESICFSTDDALLATASKGGESHKGLAVWRPNLDHGHRPWPAVGVSTVDGAARSVAFSHDSKLLAAGWAKGEVSVWMAEASQKTVDWCGESAEEIDTFKRLWRGACGTAVCSVAFAPTSEQGQWALASGDELGYFTVWGHAGEELQTHSLAGPVRSVAFSLGPGSPLLAAASGNFVTVWAATEGSWLVLGGSAETVSTVERGATVRSVAFSTVEEADPEPRAVTKSADESLGNLHVLYAHEKYDGDAPADKLTAACREGSVEKLRDAMSRVMDVQALDSRGRSALATAAYHGKQQVVKTLLEEKAVDPNVLDGGGWSPLQAACYGDHSGPSVTSLLAHPKTDPNVQPRTGCSLLFVVAQSGRVEAMRALLEDTRTSVDVPREDDGMTPFLKATEMGEAKGVELLGGRSDVSRASRVGQNALHYAVMSGNAEVLKMALSYCTEFPAMLNQRNEAKATPLFSAVSSGQADAVRMLLQHKADARLEDENGRSPLKVARVAQNAELVAMLLQALLDQTESDPRERSIAFGCLDKDYGTALAHVLRSDVKSASESGDSWRALLSLAGDAQQPSVSKEVGLALRRRPTKTRGMPHGLKPQMHETAAETKDRDAVCFRPGPDLLPPEVFLAMAAAVGEGDAAAIAAVCPPALQDLVAEVLMAPSDVGCGRTLLFLEKGLGAGLADGVGRTDGVADPVFKPLLLQYCGSIAGITRFLQDDTVFDQLQRRCEARLKLIARPLEDLCEEQELKKRLGSIGLKFFGRTISQGDTGMLPVPVFINGEKHDSEFFARALVRLIWMVSVATDSSFFAALRAALEPFGEPSEPDEHGHVTFFRGGKEAILLQRAPIKGIARMLNKLKADHATMPDPKPKWNVDPVRHGVVVYDVKLVKPVFDAIGAKVGRYLRVKNGFSPNGQSSYGYRNILCNLRHAPAGVKVADVFGEAQWPLWTQLGDALDNTGGATEQITQCLLALGQPELAASPLAIVAEVQLIYGPYFKQGRQRSHAHYRVVRCKGSTDLIRDACKPKQSTSAAEETLKQLVEKQLALRPAAPAEAPKMEFECVTKKDKVKAGKERVFALTYEPSKKLLFSGGDERGATRETRGACIISGWSVSEAGLSAAKPESPLTHRDRVSSLACTDGVLFSGSKDGGIKVWDLDIAFFGAYGKRVYALEGHEAGGGVEALVFGATASGGLLCSAGYDCTIRLWRKGTPGENEASYNPSNGDVVNTLAAAWGNAACVARLAEAGAEAVLALALSTDGHTLYSGGWRGSVCVWSTADATSEATPLETLRAPPAFSSGGGGRDTGKKGKGTKGKGKKSAVADDEDDSLAAGETNYVVALAADSRNTLLYVGSEDGDIRVWRGGGGGARAHACVATLTGHTKEVAHLLLLPVVSGCACSGCLCSGSMDGTVRVWQLSGTPSCEGAYSCVATLQEGKAPMTALAAAVLPAGSVAIYGAQKKKKEQNVIEVWRPAATAAAAPTPLGKTERSKSKGSGLLSMMKPAGSARGAGLLTMATGSDASAGTGAKAWRMLRRKFSLSGSSGLARVSPIQAQSD